MADPLRLPLFDGPYLAPSATPKARHASYTGVVQALKSKTAKQQAYEQLIRNHGPLSDVEASVMLGWPLSSVCSTRNGILAAAARVGLPAPFVAVEFETVQWARDTTKRARWGMPR